MKKWEYLIRSEGAAVSDTAVHLRLDYLGFNGWELVTAMKDRNGNHTFYFKRLKPVAKKRRKPIVYGKKK